MQDQVDSLKTVLSLYEYLHNTIQKTRTRDPQRRQLRGDSLGMLMGCINELNATITKMETGEVVNDPA